MVKCDYCGNEITRLSKHFGYTHNFCDCHCSYKFHHHTPLKIKAMSKCPPPPPESTKKNCCEIYKFHADSLKDDPERLSTDFIKKLSKCKCERKIDGIGDL